jgi:hypothetical protein
MKRPAGVIASAFLGILVLGCESGREEGIPGGQVQGSQTEDFRKTMERTGNKMMKGQMGKKAAAPLTKSPEKEKEPEKEKPSTP